jgi:1-hydroxycarotenoid 3,4-desaturase
LKARRAIIVGAGIGGLSAGIDLASRGLDVTILERSGRPGGKLREVNLNGRAIDSGPTVLTMPWVFQTLFENAGSALSEHLRLDPLESLARHAWPDGQRLDLFSDIDRSVAAITDLAGAPEGRRYRAFCDEAHRTYGTLRDSFLLGQRPSARSLIAASGLKGLVDLWQIRPFDSLWQRLGRCFRDQRLRGLFARYATYCGSSPLQAPATLMLIAHVERSGVWRVEGGMQRLADAMSELFRSTGGTIHYDTTVERIEAGDGHAEGVALESGERLAADAVIVNADVASIRQGALGRPARSALASTPAGERSLSAVTWSMLAETSGFELDHHNVFFPDDYPREFEEIFDHRQLPRRPAVYVCAQDRGPGQARPRGAERLFLIVNAPAVGDQARFDSAALQPLESAAFGLLESCGLSIETPGSTSVVTTPADFEARFPGTGGALYGSAVHGWQSPFNRPASRTRMPGLYLAGGSVHPGPGVPMVALSGRLAAAAVAADLGLSEDR